MASEAMIGAGAGTITSGARLTTALTAGRIRPDIDNVIKKITSDVAPMYFLLDKLGAGRKVTRVAFQHMESDERPLWVTVDGEVQANAATVVLDAGMVSRLRPNDILLNPASGEQMLVVSIDSATQITVTRDYGNSVAQSGDVAKGTIATGYEDDGTGDWDVVIANDAMLHIIGNTSPENSTAPTGLSSEPTIYTNYVQTMRDAIEASRRLQQTEVYGGDEWARMAGECLDAQYRQFDQTLLFQNRALLRDSNGRSLTGGFAFWVRSNVTNFSGGFTEDTLDDWLVTFFRRNQGKGKDLVVIAGETALRNLSGFNRDYLTTRIDTTKLGLKVTEYQSFNGSVTFIPHGTLSPLGTAVTNANKGWGGYMFGVNLKKAGIARLQGLKLEKNVQVPGTDGKKDVWTRDEGLFIHSERCHSIGKAIPANN